MKKIGEFKINDEFDVIKEEDSLKTAAEKLLKIKKGVLVVMDTKDENKVLGIVYDRAILQKVAEGKNTKDLKVSSVVDKNIMTVTEDADVEKVLLETNKVRPAAIIVNDKNGKFKGYFSPHDFVEAVWELQEIIARDAMAELGIQR